MSALAERVCSAAAGAGVVVASRPEPLLDDSSLVSSRLRRFACRVDAAGGCVALGGVRRAGCWPGVATVGGLASQVWGRDVFPQYDSALRAERAQKWEVRRPVLTRSAHPELVPRVATMTQARFQVCDTLRK
ncbi:hypothetical protein DIPPA_24169 [Diplonema papillatum]|nr:hypothetical protein DIPPA_24169 [Diplonema papillatum]